VKKHQRPLLILVLLLAAFLRLWQLSAMPPALYHDEAYNGLDALSLVQGKTFPQFYEGWELYAQDAHADNPPNETRFPIFFEGNYGREPVHIYLMALSIKLFGATSFAVRLVPALAGIFAVFTTYLAAKELTIDNWQLTIGNFTPLFAAFTLAILFPAIHFSRFGLRSMLFVPVETLTVYFFWRGINSTHRRWFVAAGFMLGLGLYVYAAGRLFPLLFVTFVPFWFWRDRVALRAHWQDVGLMAAVSGLTAVPILTFFFQYPYYFFFRIGYVANKGKGAVEGKAWLTWLLNIGRVFRGFFWLGETHLRHNLPKRPFLDPIQSIFFIIGTGQLLLQKLNIRTVFLWLWLLIMLLPSIMSGDAPHFGRLTGAAPVVAIIIGVGMATAYSWISRRHRHAAVAILAIALLASTVITIRDYFGTYANHPQLAADFYQPDWAMGQYAAAQSTDTTLYLIPTQEEMATIYFALAAPERIGSYTDTGNLIAAGIADKPSLYLLRPDDQAAITHLTRFFPDGVMSDEQDGFLPFHVSSAATESALAEATAQESTASFANTIKLNGWKTTQDGDQLHLTLVWQAMNAIPRNYTAYIHLLDQDGNLVAQQDRPPAGYPTSNWRIGERIVDTFAIPLPVDGVYTLQTGFYDSETVERVGETAVLDEIVIESAP